HSPWAMMAPQREAEVLGAISHPARRRTLDLRVDGGRPVNTIAANFKMSRPALSQHVRILLDAGLVTEQRHGDGRRYRPAPGQREAEVLGAISDAARRRMLDLLVDGERPVNTIAANFKMSRRAVSQHLRILLAAGLVTEPRHGRERRYRLAPEQLGPVRDWL